MVGAEPTMATISHENSRTTIVRMAVAVSESVFRMPHFARMDVSPANSAEPNANRIHMTMPSSYILFHAVDEKRLAVYSEDSNESWFHQKCWGSGSLPGPVLAKKVEHRDKIL